MFCSDGSPGGGILLYYRGSAFVGTNGDKTQIPRGMHRVLREGEGSRRGPYHGGRLLDRSGSVTSLSSVTSEASCIAPAYSMRQPPRPALLSMEDREVVVRVPLSNEEMLRHPYTHIASCGQQAEEPTIWAYIAG